MFVLGTTQNEKFFVESDEARGVSDFYDDDEQHTQMTRHLSHQKTRTLIFPDMSYVGAETSFLGCKNANAKRADDT